MLGFDVRHDVNSNPIFSYLVFFSWCKGRKKNLMFSSLQLKTFVLPRWGGLPKQKKRRKSCSRFSTFFKNWSGWLDSNKRPLAPQTNTLTGLSYIPIAAIVGLFPQLRCKGSKISQHDKIFLRFFAPRSFKISKKIVQKKRWGVKTMWRKIATFAQLYTFIIDTTQAPMCSFEADYYLNTNKYNQDEEWKNCYSFLR